MLIRMVRRLTESPRERYDRRLEKAKRRLEKAKTAAAKYTGPKPGNPDMRMVRAGTRAKKVDRFIDHYENYKGRHDINTQGLSDLKTERDSWDRHDLARTGRKVFHKAWITYDGQQNAMRDAWRTLHPKDDSSKPSPPPMPEQLSVVPDDIHAVPMRPAPRPPTSVPVGAWTVDDDSTDHIVGSSYFRRLTGAHSDASMLSMLNDFWLESLQGWVSEWPPRGDGNPWTEASILEHLATRPAEGFAAPEQEEAFRTCLRISQNMVGIAKTYEPSADDNLQREYPALFSREFWNIAALGSWAGAVLSEDMHAFIGGKERVDMVADTLGTFLTAHPDIWLELNNAMPAGVEFLHEGLLHMDMAPQLSAMVQLAEERVENGRAVLAALQDDNPQNRINRLMPQEGRDRVHEFVENIQKPYADPDAGELINDPVLRKTIDEILDPKGAELTPLDTLAAGILVVREAEKRSNADFLAKTLPNEENLAALEAYVGYWEEVGQIFSRLRDVAQLPDTEPGFPAIAGLARKEPERGWVDEEGDAVGACASAPGQAISEDALAMMHTEHGHRIYVLADGHGGGAAAALASDAADMICADLAWMRESDLAPGEAFSTAFRGFHQHVMNHAGGYKDPGQEATAGAAVVAVTIDDENISVGSAGNCEAVLCRSDPAGAHHMMVLSNKRELSDPDEARTYRQRLAAKGWPDHTRVAETTAGIGDVMMQGGDIDPRYDVENLSNNPTQVEVDTVTVPRADGDQFIIIASDGLWDALRHDDACRAVLELRRKGWPDIDIAAELAGMASVSRDHCAVQIVNLRA